MEKPIFLPLDKTYYALLDENKLMEMKMYRLRISQLTILWNS